MKFIADFHIHSKYSRATSRQMDLENINKWAKIKGVQVITPGDFTHPVWLRELKQKLEPAEEGLYTLKDQFTNSQPGIIEDDQARTRFILTTEISCVYSKGGRVRKLHVVVFAPNLKVVEEINKELSKVGNLKADGRPILGLDAKELAKIVLNVSSDCLVVPAHCLTPWFGIFGSKSGFNSIEECFEDYSKYIFAIETGLSADCPMIWRIADGRRLTLISNSDAHGPTKIGREANVFDTELSYPAIIEAIKSKNPKKLLYTIEFFPQEGKYHYDGHRICGLSLSPQESERYNYICPSCGKPLTLGVLNRVRQLADREEGFKPEGAIGFQHLVPLAEIIAAAIGKGVATKAAEDRYWSLIKKFGSEFEILLNVSYARLRDATLKEIAEGIMRAREGKVQVIPGYDGVFGKIKIFPDWEQREVSRQGTLF